MNVLVDPDAHPVIAHRGNSKHVPENTLHAFDEAIALAVDAIELDVRATHDDVPVVIHDGTVDRTTDAHGSVASFTAAEIRQLDAGFRFTRDNGQSYPWRARGHVIPLLDEVLDRYREMPLLIEVKETRAVAPTLDAVRRHDAVKRVVLASSDHACVQPFRGDFLTGASSADTATLLREIVLGRARESLPYECLSIPRWYRGLPLPVRRIAQAARRAGVATHVWTVDAPSLARALWDRGVNGVVTNDPGAIFPVRRELFGGVRDRRKN